MKNKLTKYELWQLFGDFRERQNKCKVGSTEWKEFNAVLLFIRDLANFYDFEKEDECCKCANFNDCKELDYKEEK